MSNLDQYAGTLNKYTEVRACPTCGTPNPGHSRCIDCLSELMDKDVQEMSARVSSGYPQHHTEVQSTRPKWLKKWKFLFWGLLTLMLGLHVMVIGEFIQTKQELDAVRKAKEEAKGSGVILTMDQIQKIREEAVTSGTATFRLIVVVIGGIMALGGLGISIMMGASKTGRGLLPPGPSSAMA